MAIVLILYVWLVVLGNMRIEDFVEEYKDLIFANRNITDLSEEDKLKIKHVSEFETWVLNKIGAHKTEPKSKKLLKIENYDI